MKTVIIEATDTATARLLLDLAKRMGLKASIEKKRVLKYYPMPDDDKVLEKMMDDAEKSFTEGKGLSTKEVKKIVRSWK
jgi:hypothetical protein